MQLFKGVSVVMKTVLQRDQICNSMCKKRKYISIGFKVFQDKEISTFEIEQ